jgi:hypothetical protein
MADRGWLPEPATLQQMPVATPYLDGLLGITLRVPITISAAPSAADHLPIHAFTYSTAVVSGLPSGAFGLFCD